MNKTTFKNEKAFTLAETLIALVILGIIAAVTIPTLIRNHVDNANRAKVKKAMSMYENDYHEYIPGQQREDTGFDHLLKNYIKVPSNVYVCPATSQAELDNIAKIGTRFKDDKYYGITLQMEMRFGSITLGSSNYPLRKIMQVRQPSKAGVVVIIMLPYAIFTASCHYLMKFV